MKSISPRVLQEKLQNKEKFQLIDIREPYEFEDGALCSTNIPLDDMMNSIDEISTTKQVVIYCRSGKRSSAIIFMLEKHHEFKNLYNLEGGYAAYLDL